MKYENNDSEKIKKFIEDFSNGIDLNGHDGFSNRIKNGYYCNLSNISLDMLSKMSYIAEIFNYKDFMNSFINLDKTLSKPEFSEYRKSFEELGLINKLNNYKELFKELEIGFTYEEINKLTMPSIDDNCIYSYYFLKDYCNLLTNDDKSKVYNGLTLTDETDADKIIYMYNNDDFLKEKGVVSLFENCIEQLRRKKFEDLFVENITQNDLNNLMESKLYKMAYPALSRIVNERNDLSVDWNYILDNIDREAKCLNFLFENFDIIKENKDEIKLSNKKYETLEYLSSQYKHFTTEQINFPDDFANIIDCSILPKYESDIITPDVQNIILSSLRNDNIDENTKKSIIELYVGILDNKICAEDFIMATYTNENFDMLIKQIRKELDRENYDALIDAFADNLNMEYTKEIFEEYDEEYDGADFLDELATIMKALQSDEIEMDDEIDEEVDDIFCSERDEIDDSDIEEFKALALKILKDQEANKTKSNSEETIDDIIDEAKQNKDNNDLDNFKNNDHEER